MARNSHALVYHGPLPIHRLGVAPSAFTTVCIYNIHTYISIYTYIYVSRKYFIINMILWLNMDETREARLVRCGCNICGNGYMIRCMIHHGYMIRDKVDRVYSKIIMGMKIIVILISLAWTLA